MFFDVKIISGTLMLLGTIRDNWSGMKKGREKVLLKKSKKMSTCT